MPSSIHLRGFVSADQSSILEILTDTTVAKTYMLPQFQCRGYMTQALNQAIEELLQNGYEEVICGAFENNLASMRVMEKCGMQKQDYTDTLEYRGETHRCLYYAARKEP